MKLYILLGISLVVSVVNSR